MLPRGNLMFFKQIFAREAKQYSSFMNSKFPSSFCSPLNFFSVRYFKNIFLIILNFLDENREIQCKI